MMRRHLFAPRRDAALVLVIASLVIGCGRAASDEDVETTTVVPVMTMPATTGTIHAVIHTTGEVTPAPGADLQVRPPEAARIAEMPRAEGDRVRRGDLLVRFEIPSLTADAATRQAQVTAAQARVANAKTAQTRAHDLFDRGVAARREVEDADRELADAQAALAEAQAGRSAAETSASRTIVRATFDGVVASRTHNPGDLVDPSDVVLRVIDPARLQVTAHVPLAAVPRIMVGAPARLTSEMSIPLTVISRPAAVAPGTGSVPVRLAFQMPTMLPAGMPVEVAIDAEPHDNVVIVPLQAIVHEGEQAAVFVADGGKARRRNVELGVSDDQRVEVRSGLKAGEPVIVQGQAGLPDGASITVAGGK
jgi:RND family efflux transporter MFP subunit